MMTCAEKTVSLKCNDPSFFTHSVFLFNKNPFYWNLAKWPPQCYGNLANAAKKRFNESKLFEIKIKHVPLQLKNNEEPARFVCIIQMFYRLSTLVTKCQEIAYVGTINSNHYELTKQLLENGKHVLCEKPMVLNARLAKELVQLARNKKLFLMEGYWSRCFPLYKRLVLDIASGTLGNVFQVNATFSIKIDHVDRVTKKELGGGALLDIGIYALQLASLVFGGEKPEKIVAAGHLNENGVDEFENVTLLYSNGRMASLLISSKQVLPNDAYVVGTNGYIKIEQPFWCPTEMTMPDKTVWRNDLPKVDGHFNFSNSEGLAYEAQEVARCLKQGLKESPLISLDESILLAEICDEIRKQLGVRYDCD